MLHIHASACYTRIRMLQPARELDDYVTALKRCEQVWDMHEEEVQAKVLRMLQADKLIHEQQVWGEGGGGGHALRHSHCRICSSWGCCLQSCSSYYYYMCPHTTMYVSSYHYICVRIPLYMCPHTTIYVSSYHYICVRIPLYTCALQLGLLWFPPAEQELSDRFARQRQEAIREMNKRMLVGKPNIRKSDSAAQQV
jgi:hypothetical protein